MSQMKAFYAKMRLKLAKIKGKWFKVRLPLNHLALSRFSDEIIKTYELPDLPTFRQSIAVMIQHLAPDCVAVHPYTIARAIKKAIANQIAYEAIQVYREKAKQAEEAAKADAPAI